MELEIIAAFSSYTEAAVLQRYLQDSGMVAFISNDYGMGLMGPYLLGGGVRVKVLSTDAEAVRALLDSFGSMPEAAALEEVEEAESRLPKSERLALGACRAAIASLLFLPLQLCGLWLLLGWVLQIRRGVTRRSLGFALLALLGLSPTLYLLWSWGQGWWPFTAMVVALGLSHGLTHRG